MGEVLLLEIVVGFQQQVIGSIDRSPARSRSSRFLETTVVVMLEVVVGNSNWMWFWCDDLAPNSLGDGAIRRYVFERRCSCA